VPRSIDDPTLSDRSRHTGRHPRRDAGRVDQNGDSDPVRVGCRGLIPRLHQRSGRQVPTQCPYNTQLPPHIPGVPQDGKQPFSAAHDGTDSLADFLQRNALYLSALDFRDAPGGLCFPGTFHGGINRLMQVEGQRIHQLRHLPAGQLACFLNYLIQGH